ncbi:YheC/YheD family protein [Paenibacillus sp.]|uniref:YheC/YheD family protein n=1 Tax=Paenibacillus sp. TaxID=58172 RepID=UPI002810A538|nr:YheC/YheD family protein [Paenibacillus sp.]
MLKKRYWHVKNKWTRHLSLAGHPVLNRHLPPTRLLRRKTLRKFLKKYGVVYVKPVYGSFGNRILRIAKRDGAYFLHYENKTKRFKSRKKCLKRVFRHTRSQLFHIQRGIRLVQLDGHPIDFRVLLLRPKSSWRMMGIMGKAATGNRVVTNYHHGGRPVRFREALRRAGWSDGDIRRAKREIERLCLIAAERFGKRHKHCRRLGIDIGLDREKRIWFIEVNTNPYYELFRYHEDRKLYGKIARHMKRIKSIQSNRW